MEPEDTNHLKEASPQRPTRPLHSILTMLVSYEAMLAALKFCNFDSCLLVSTGQGLYSTDV